MHCCLGFWAHIKLAFPKSRGGFLRAIGAPHVPASIASVVCRGFADMVRHVSVREASIDLVIMRPLLQTGSCPLRSSCRGDATGARSGPPCQGARYYRAHLAVSDIGFTSRPVGPAYSSRSCLNAALSSGTRNRTELRSSHRSTWSSCANARSRPWL